MSREKQFGEYLFSDDKGKLQKSMIHSWISSKSYWAQNIPYSVMEKAIGGSRCYGIYRKKEQLGFARVITDDATFAYLADVFVLEEHRGKGLSKELMKFILEDERLKKMRRFMLATKDAHALYSKFGFTPLSSPERFMEIKPFEKY
jgi:GNAT superfamily N-acetyltransferase